MRLLLDTHVLIWWWTNEGLLPPLILQSMTDEANEIFVSAATGWEIATKVRRGQLPEMRRYMPNFQQDVLDDGFRHLTLNASHGVRGGLLKGVHKDPFDRILAAQALVENMIVVTRDAEIATFGCRTLW